MAIYHLSVKPVQRSAGNSSTAAAAYRAGARIVDDRTGEINDYRRKGGVESAEIILPAGAPAWATDRAALWNAAEAAEKRKDGTPAREYVVALPSELDADQRRELAHQFAKEMADREGCAVDVAIHLPGRGGDDRNHHAHILRTTRKVTPEGLGAKLDTEKAGRDRKADLSAVRERWASMVNAALSRAGQGARVDHRSNADRGSELTPTIHVGRGRSPERRQYNDRVRAMKAELVDARAELAAMPAPRRRAPAISQADIEAARQDNARRLAAAVKTVDQEEMQRFRRGLKAALFMQKVPTPPREPKPPVPDDNAPPAPPSTDKKIRPR